MKTQPNILYEDGKLWLVEVPERPKELIDARTKPDHILIKIEDAYKFALSEAIKNKMEIVNWEEHFTKLSFKTIEPIGRNYVIKEGEFYEWKGIWVKKRQFRPIGSIQYFDFTGLHTHSEGYEFRYVIELSLPEQGHEEKMVHDDGKYLRKILEDKSVGPSLKTDEAYKCKDCGAAMNEGEAKTFTVCDDCWDKHYAAIKESALSENPVKPEPVKTEEKSRAQLLDELIVELEDMNEIQQRLYMKDVIINLRSKPVLHDDQERKDFCIWYYAQSQPLDANRVFDYFTRKSL